MDLIDLNGSKWIRTTSGIDRLFVDTRPAGSVLIWACYQDPFGIAFQGVLIWIRSRLCPV